MHSKVAGEDAILSLVSLVRAEARRLNVPKQVYVEDLEGTGWLAAVQAVRQFNPSKGRSLYIFAQHKIRGAMVDSLRKLDMMGRKARKAVKRVEAVTRELQVEKLRQPTHGEITERLGYEIPTGAQEAPVEEAQNVGIPFVADFTTKHDLDRLIKATVLSDRECRVLYRVFYDERTQVSVARELGLHEASIVNLKRSALKKLRESAERKGSIYGSPMANKRLQPIQTGTYLKIYSGNKRGQGGRVTVTGARPLTSGEAVQSQRSMAV